MLINFRTIVQISIKQMIIHLTHYKKNSKAQVRKLKNLTISQEVVNKLSSQYSMTLKLKSNYTKKRP